ncbi:MAG: hypothetical protein K0S88_1860 [Actinomycetia bacterium]|jgi:hypothetical protein|nr:hypothetical protein [Actinomycetes bacterium]
MTEELFSELRTLQDVWDYVWSGYAVTIDARRRVMLGVRQEPRLPLAVAEPGPLMTHAVGLAGPAGMTLQQLRELFDLLDKRRFERGLVQLRASGRLVETTELRPSRAGDVQPQAVLRCR